MTHSTRPSTPVASPALLRAGRVLIASVLVIAVLAPGAVNAQSAPTPPNSSIVVVPFDNATQEPRLTWMREGAAILLGEMLRGAGEVVIDREERLQAFDRLQLPAGATLSRASTIKVGQVVAASLVVSGTVAMAGDQLIAHARGVRIDTGRLLPDVEARGPLTDLYGVFGRLAQQVRGSAAPPPVASDRLPAMPQVFELYVKGLVAETPSTVK